MEGGVTPRHLDSFPNLTIWENLGKNVIKCYLEEYFGVDIQMKVVNFEF